MQWLDKQIRRLLSKRLERADRADLAHLGEARALKAFARAVRVSDTYRRLLKLHGCAPGSIRTIDDLRSRCPVIYKQDLFGSSSAEELFGRGDFTHYANAITSSGFSGRFSFMLHPRANRRQSIRDIDLGLQLAFNADRASTLIVNCLPMGVTFESNVATIVNTSVREDIALAVIRQLKHRYAQAVIVGDPLFLKRLVDSVPGEAAGSLQGCHVVIGGESFAESYRDYLARSLAVNLDRREAPFIGSSMGVAELGLNLFYETRESVALRRLARDNPECFKELFQADPEAEPLPQLFAYNPLRTYVEVLATPMARAFGDLAVTMLGRHPLPMIRYATGDSGRLIDPSVAEHWLRSTPYAGSRLPLPLLALSGRSSDRLPDATHLNQYKEALFSDPRVARAATGAFRLTPLALGVSMELQLRPGIQEDGELRAQLIRAIGRILPSRTVDVRCWQYERFPYGMTLDYQRKFCFYSPLPPAPARV